MAIDRQLTESPIMPGTDGIVSVDQDYRNIDASIARVTESDGNGAEVSFGEEEPEAVEYNHYENIAENLDERYLSSIAVELIGLFEDDKQSRSEWEETYKNGLDLLGLKIEERTEPWVGACGISHPLLAEATVRFQSQQIAEMFPASGPVRTKIVGEETEDVIRQANRVAGYMNYLVTEEMEEYREEVDKMLFALPLAGSAFKKTYYDPSFGRPVSEFVPAEDIVVGSGTKSLSSCRRLTHVIRDYPNEIRKKQFSGFYRHTEVRESTPEIDEVSEKKDELSGIDRDSSKNELVTLLEMHVDYDIEGYESNYALPYIITIDKDSRTVLSIYRNWEEGDDLAVKNNYFTHYQYVPGLGFYGYGLIHLIGGIARGSTSILRQLVDAGTLSNLPGGFKSKNLRVRGDNTPIAAGEWRDVDVPGGKIADNLFPLPYGEPSTVLANLLGVIVEEGRRFASLTDINISSMNNEAPVGTTLALLERNLKVMTAISSRIHAEQRKEFRILAGIIKKYKKEYPYSVDDGATIEQDFDGRVDVLPVSDPNSSTMAQRIITMQTALELAARSPQLYTNDGLAKLHRKMLSALEIQDVEDIIPTSSDIKPMDPVSENQHILNGSPVRAYPEQDHQAHIQVHMLAMQDPKIQSLLEGSPSAQQGYAAGMAHVTEHLAYEYRNQIEAELGVPLPPMGEQLPPKIEARLSRLIAEAASKLFDRNSADMARQEAEEKLQDPVIQDQIRTTEIKAMDAETRAKEAETRAQIEVAKLIQKQEIENEKLEQQREIAAEKIRGQILGDILRAASMTEQIESAESVKIAEFIMSMAEKESDEARKALEERVKDGDDNLQLLVSLVNRMAEGE